MAVPALVLVVGAMTYVLTGRALRPVEQIRRRTSQISDADLDTRIDVPTTGDEVAELARTLNGMLDRLHAASQAQARFVADASHELRTPLAAVRAELDITTRLGRVRRLAARRRPHRRVERPDAAAGRRPAGPHADVGAVRRTTRRRGRPGRRRRAGRLPAAPTDGGHRPGEHDAGAGARQPARPRTGGAEPRGQRGAPRDRPGGALGQPAGRHCRGQRRRRRRRASPRRPGRSCSTGSCGSTRDGHASRAAAASASRSCGASWRRTAAASSRPTSDLGGARFVVRLPVSQSQSSAPTR